MPIPRDDAEDLAWLLEPSEEPPEPEPPTAQALADDPPEGDDGEEGWLADWALAGDPIDALDWEEPAAKRERRRAARATTTLLDPVVQPMGRPQDGRKGAKGAAGPARESEKEQKTAEARPAGEGGRVDPLSEAARSALMAKVKSARTKPEMAFRSALRAIGLTGYRTTPEGLPGRPDVAFIGPRVAVFVDGCFWHGCSSCYRKPAGNAAYWEAKRERNMERDARVTAVLESRGWMVVRFWEHELRGEGARAAAERVQLLVGQRLAEKAAKRHAGAAGDATELAQKAEAGLAPAREES
jgi:DNA mismatch endonuclease, patch repair protein